MKRQSMSRTCRKERRFPLEEYGMAFWKKCLQAGLRRKSTVLPKYVWGFGCGMREEKKEKRQSTWTTSSQVGLGGRGGVRWKMAQVASMAV